MISRDDMKVVLQRLADEHSVEGIAVMALKKLQARYRFFVERHDSIPWSSRWIVNQGCGCSGSGSLASWNLIVASQSETKLR